ncbi:MAG TPA: hypothetical protein VF081_09330 [Solirubrobacterales bacterium]
MALDQAIPSRQEFLDFLLEMSGFARFGACGPRHFSDQPWFKVAEAISV